MSTSLTLICLWQYRNLPFQLTPVAFYLMAIFFWMCFQQISKFYFVQSMKKILVFLIRSPQESYWLPLKCWHLPTVIANDVAVVLHYNYFFLATLIQLYIFLNALLNTVMVSSSSKVSTCSWLTEQNWEEKANTTALQGILSQSVWKLLFLRVTF